MCGVVGVYNIPNTIDTVRDGLHMLQHRGQESAGTVFSDGKEFYRQVTLGLADRLEEPDVFSPIVGIGHTHYGTSGERTSIENAQPFVIESPYGQFSIAHNGDTQNYELLRKHLTTEGIKFVSTSDTEIIGHFIASAGENSLIPAMLKALHEMKSTFALVVATHDAVIGCRDPSGNRPLSLGRMGRGYILASETSVFEPLKAEYMRDIEPGELVWINANGIKSYRLGDVMSKKRSALCSFELIYFSRPDSVVFGRQTAGFRMELGAELFHEVGLPNCHPDYLETVFTGVPDSAMFVAEGYAKAAEIQLSTIFVRHHYESRTFTRAGKERRAKSVRLKFNLVPGSVRGKWVVLIDDSIVRGTTMRQLISMLRANGAYGVSVLIASPPIRYPCYYGIDMKNPAEIIATQFRGSIGDIRNAIEADELFYLSHNGLTKVLQDAKSYCLACFNGQYAI